MYRLVAALCAVVCFGVVGEAQAKRGGGSGWAQELVFVTETEIPGDAGQKTSLCILAKQRNIIGFINLWKSPESYALAVNKCDTEQYRPLTAADFVAGQQAGVFPAALPVDPQLGLMDKIKGAWGTALIALLALVAIFKIIGSRRRAAGRKSALGDLTEVQHRVIEVMCQAAFTDGQIDESEINVIRKAAQDITGRAYSADQIHQIVATCDKNISDQKFKSYGKGLSEDQKAVVIQGAMMVFAADGQLAKKEQVFLGKLAGGMKIGPDRLRAIIAAG